jgi:hypothetical protein
MDLLATTVRILMRTLLAVDGNFYLTQFDFSKAIFGACRVCTKVRTEAMCPTMDLLATMVRILMRTLLANSGATLQNAPCCEE